MGVLRQLNVVGQMRLDVPHIRSLESAVAADFDLLTGRIVAGGLSYIIKGFTLAMSTAVGNPATNLQLNVAGGSLVHPLASESGSIFFVEDDAAPETLSVTNAKIVGGFTANSTNFVGIDLRRTADGTTADVVQVIDANTRIQTPKTIPLARVLDFRIVISTTDFASTPHVCPVAKVTTDASNNVTAIEDCRQMLFRLGTGGSNPDRAYSFPWTGNRSEGISGTTIFEGGDKQLGSLKDSLDAIMTRLWELGGGQYWYSATSDREIKLAKGPTVIPATGDNFQWTLGTSTLDWTDISLVFGNTAGWYNDIVDDSIVLADGECAYVDVDRTANRTGGTALAMQKATLTTLGSPTTPGSRFIIAWRKGNYIFIRDRDYQVGRVVNVATNLVQGTVKLSYAAGTPADPVVVPLNSDGGIAVTATGVAAPAVYATGGPGGGAGVVGNGTAEAGIIGVGGAGSAGGHFTGGTDGEGVVATGTGIGEGVRAKGGGTNGTGVLGTGGTATNGIGVEGVGTGTASGVKGTGGGTNGVGVEGTGGATNGHGVVGTGTGTGKGVSGTGGGTDGIGVEGVGGVTNGIGVRGAGAGSGAGVVGVAGATSGTSGVEGTGSGTGAGVKGTGGTNGPGVSGIGGATTGPGVRGAAGASGQAGGEFTGGATGHAIVLNAGANGRIADMNGRETIYSATVSTTNATVTTIFSITIPANTGVYVEADIIGRRTDTGINETNAYKLCTSVHENGAGGLANLNQSIIFTGESAGETAWTVDAGISGTNLLIRVTGEAAKSINWAAMIRMRFV